MLTECELDDDADEALLAVLTDVVELVLTECELLLELDDSDEMLDVVEDDRLLRLDLVLDDEELDASVSWRPRM